MRIGVCQKCEISKLLYNQEDLTKGCGKLYGWCGGLDKVDYFFVGLNPSYNRFPGLMYAFGGRDFDKGTGVEFVNILRDLKILEKSYVTNAVKCSTDSNTVERLHISNCLEYLMGEVELHKPKVFITMGKPVSQFLQNDVQFCQFLVYNNIEFKEIWHPNYVISYNRDKIDQYKRMIIEAVHG